MEVTSFIIVGAVVSLIVQYLKNRWGTNTQGTLASVVVISLLAGTAYYFVEKSEFLPVVIQILAFAGAIYTYFLKRFE